MEFLSSHWHCILPVVGIAIAMFFMRDKKKDRDHEEGKNTPRISSDGWCE